MPFAASSEQVSDAVFGVAVLAGSYALKRHYSTASADELAWVLRPTAWIANVFTGGAFVAERGVGYLSTTFRTAIVPACAGVNFLIVAWCTLGFGFIHALRARRAKLLWFPATFLLGYVATVVVNGARVAFGIGIHRLFSGTGFISREGEHRAMGVAVYLLSLWLLFAGVHAALERRERSLCPRIGK